MGIEKYKWKKINFAMLETKKEDILKYIIRSTEKYIKSEYIQELPCMFTDEILVTMKELKKKDVLYATTLLAGLTVKSFSKKT